MDKITVLKGENPLEVYKELNARLDPSGERKLPIGNIVCEQYEWELKGVGSVEITDEEIENEKKWKHEPCGLYPDGWEDGFSACWNYIKTRINQ